MPPVSNSGALLSSRSSSSQQDLVLATTRCIDQCWQVSAFQVVSTGPLPKKKELCSFARSKVTEGVPNINSRSRDPDHAPFGVIHHPLCSTRRGLSNKEQEGRLSPTERASVSAISLRHILASSGYTPGTIAVIKRIAACTHLSLTVSQ